MLLAAAQADAVPPPAGLEVQQGGGWLRETRFGLRWRNPAPAGTVAAVHQRLLDPLGRVVAGPTRVEGAFERLEGLRLPASPGVYSAEVWLEDALGVEGPAASTPVRFDNTRPGDVEPLPEAGWIGRAELPYRLRISHPAGPPPLAGIRGYAVSIAAKDSVEPCADARACTDPETDLRAGVEGDSLEIPELPHGVSHVRAVAVSGSGMRSASSGHAVLAVDRIDPVTRLSGAPQGWTDRAVVLRAEATDADSGMGAGAQTAIRVDGLPPALAAGDSAAVSILDEGIHEVAYYARDAAGNVNDGRTANGRRNPPPGTATVRIDRTPPDAFLVGSAGPRAPETIEARVGDALSGPHPDRGAIALRRRGSALPWEPLRTTVDTGTLRAHWSTEDYPVGEYEFRVVGFDAAGNSVASRLRANGTPLVLPNPLKPGARLEALVGGGEATTIQAGRSALLTGSLLLYAGANAAGRPIEVVERFDDGARPGHRATVVETGADGSFRLLLAPGPSREVAVRYRGDRLTNAASIDPLRLRARSGVTLGASAGVAVVGGRPIRFSGRVATDGAKLPREGLAVRLQFRLPGTRWREFRTLSTDRRGRFRYRYAFSDDDSRGARFQFRAFAPTQDDWPFEPGGSRPVVVRGA